VKPESRGPITPGSVAPGGWWVMWATFSLSSWSSNPAEVTLTGMSPRFRASMCAAPAASRSG
jgi:hypothetical protein